MQPPCTTQRWELASGDDLGWSMRAMVGWRSGWRRRCWFAMVLQPSRDGFGIAQAGRQRTALSDRASERSDSVRSPRMEIGHLAQASLRQASGWLERGVAAAVRLSRYRQRAAMQPRQIGPHAAAALGRRRPAHV